jgi:hypothetical protein
MIIQPKVGNEQNNIGDKRRNVIGQKKGQAVHDAMTAVIGQAYYQR